MNVRLTSTDLTLVNTIKNHFAGLHPLPVRLNTAEVVRIALRTTVEEKLQPHDPHPELDWESRERRSA